MNAKNAALFIPIVEALAAGKTVQISPHGDGVWNDAAPGWELNLNLEANQYRIKPEPATDTTAPLLDLTKPVQTRLGLKVTLYTTHARGDFPLMGIIHENDYDRESSWRPDGGLGLPGRPDHEYDLVNVPQRNFRPWKDISEVPVRAYVRMKANPDLALHTITGAGDVTGCIFINAKCPKYPDGKVSYQDAAIDLDWSPDRVTWFNCGVVE